MTKRKSTKTTKKQIIEWGMKNIDECGYGVDASEMDTHCWRCGHESHTEKCHVIPDSLDGVDEPSNFRLFCPNCHLEQPNVNDYDATDNWVRKTSVGFYNVFWTYREIWYKLGFQTINHWGQNTNAETIKWRVKKFYELSGADSGLIDQEQLFNCIESMQVIPEHFQKGDIPNLSFKELVNA